MGFFSDLWSAIRDPLESAAVVAGNYLLPGSSLVTGNLASKGSQEQLQSPVGMLANIGAGSYGAYSGNMSNYADAWNSLTSGGDAPGVEGYGVNPGMGASPSVLSQLGQWGSNLFSGGSPWTTSSTGLNVLGSEAGGGGGAPGMSSWLSPLMSVGSGLYGLSLAEQQKKLAQQAILGSAPWAASGGTAMAGDALKTAISGDLSNDPGFLLAQQAAARTSSTQPGGYAAKAASDAALQFQNQRIAALSGPAGTGFAPGTGYQTAVQGTASGNQLASQSLGSIGFGVNQATGGSPSMPPWLQQYLIQNGMTGASRG